MSGQWVQTEGNLPRELSHILFLVNTDTKKEIIYKSVVYNYGTSNLWWIVPLTLLCCVLEAEPAPCLANHFDCLSLSWTDSGSGIFWIRQLNPQKPGENKSHSNSPVISKQCGFHTYKLVGSACLVGKSFTLVLLFVQFLEPSPALLTMGAFSRTLGSVRFLCNPIYNVLALPTIDNLAVPPCVIQLVSPDTALEPLLSPSGRDSHVCLGLLGEHMAPLFWEVQFCGALRNYRVL